MRVLAIDSSCSSATCAIVSDNKVESQIYMNNKLKHSVVLFPMIENVLKMLEIGIEDIDGVAVSGGPGSFTGLRIGVSAAKGIAQGGNKKFIAISSLDSMAFQQVYFDGIICPIMDALRDNVYTCLYTWEDKKISKMGEYEAVHIDELIKKLKTMEQKVIFCGDGVQLHKETIIDNLKEKAYFSPLISNMPTAASIGELAILRFKEGIEDDIYTYSPIYIRKCQAENELEKRECAKLE